MFEGVNVLVDQTSARVQTNLSTSAFDLSEPCGRKLNSRNRGFVFSELSYCALVHSEENSGEAEFLTSVQSSRGCAGQQGFSFDTHHKWDAGRQLVEISLMSVLHLFITAALLLLCNFLTVMSGCLCTSLLAQESTQNLSVES